MASNGGIMTSQPSTIHTYHTTTTDAWDAMLNACSAANSSIYMEEFIIEPDSIGDTFMEVLERKASEGVEVKLLLDGWGCRKVKGSFRFKRMVQAGVKIAFFRPFSFTWLIKPSEIFPRDHRKIFIIDREKTFVGGVCIYDDIKDWRDTMVELSGGLTKQFIYIFENTWRKSEAENPEETTAHPAFETEASFSVYANAPDSEEHYFTDALIARINTAQHSVKLATPYFTSKNRIVPALIEAAQRGVDVTLILSNYSKYSPYVVGKALCGELISRGVKIYYYEPTMLHLKMMIIDEAWAAIGSCNLDGLSINHNQEAMLVSTDDNFIKELSGHFADDETSSVRFSYADWQTRPLSQKIMGAVYMPFAKYL